MCVCVCMYCIYVCVCVFAVKGVELKEAIPVLVVI